MAQIEKDAGGRPHSKHALLGLGVLIKSEDSNWSVIQAVHHAGSSSKIVQLLRDVEVSGVEDHAEGPTCKSKVAETEIVRSKGVATWDFSAKSSHAPAMSKEVKEREEHRKRFLHAHEPVEWPFPVKLNNRLHHRRVTRFPLVGDDMLTDVIALLRARPEKESQTESCKTSVLFGLATQLTPYADDHSLLHSSRPCIPGCHQLGCSDFLR